jgi:hypothetical protein
MGGPTIDDAAAGMTGLLGGVMLAGVGTAAGMATVNMIDRMGRQATQPKRRKRQRKR